MINFNTGVYEIIDRHIVLPLNIETFGVVGDENSKVLQFRTDRFVDGADLSSKEIYVCFKNASALTGEKLAENIQFTSKLLTFNWFVPSQLTATAGQVELYVEFRAMDEENNKVYVLRTTPIIREVKDSFDIYNDAAEADYHVLDSFISQNQDQIDRKDLVDSDLPFRVIDREIQFNPSYTVAVEKDSLSQVMSFRLKRTVNNIDRSAMHFTFHFTNAANETGIDRGSNIMYTEDEIFVSWGLDGRVTKTAGNVTFKIQINGTLDNGDAYRWNTLDAVFEIKKSFDTANDIEIPSQDWFTSWEAETNNAIGRASSYANAAKDYYYKIMNQANNSDNLIADMTDKVTEAQQYSNMAQDAAASITSLSASRSNKDANGVFTIVEYFRTDNTLYMRSTLQEDTSGSLHYINRLEQLFEADGTTVKSSSILPITYDADGVITGQFGMLNQLLYHFPNTN